MKLFKLFLKNSFSSAWQWLSFILAILGILEYYFNLFKDIKYMNEILFFSIIGSIIYKNYKLYSKIASEYPDSLIKYNKSLEFDDCCSFFQYRKIYPKLCLRYKVNIVEDSNNASFEVGDVSENYVILKFFHKVYIKNLTNKDIQISEPVIKLFSVNNIKDSFFINRLNVSLGKIRFSNERYICCWNDFRDLIQKYTYKFPCTINKKQEVCIFLYTEVNLKSFDENSFNELLNWIRNISLKVEFFIIKSGKEVKNSYIMKYNYKKDLIINMINEKINDDKEFQDSLNQLNRRC